MYAAVFCSPVRCFVWVVLYLFLCLFLCQDLYCKLCYSCQDFTGYGFQCKLSITSDFQWTDNIAEDIARTPRSPWIVVRPRK